MPRAIYWLERAPGTHWMECEVRVLSTSNSCSRFLERFINPRPIRKFTAIYGTLRFITVFTIVGYFFMS